MKALIFCRKDKHRAYKLNWRFDIEKIDSKRWRDG